MAADFFSKQLWVGSVGPLFLKFSHSVNSSSCVQKMHKSKNGDACFLMAVTIYSSAHCKVYRAVQYWVCVGGVCVRGDVLGCVWPIKRPT